MTPSRLRWAVAATSLAFNLLTSVMFRAKQATFKWGNLFLWMEEGQKLTKTEELANKAKAVGLFRQMVERGLLMKSPASKTELSRKNLMFTASQRSVPCRCAAGGA